MKRIFLVVLFSLLLIGTAWGQKSRPTNMPADFTELVDWVLTGQETFTYKTITSPILNGTISITGTSYLNLGSSGTPLSITTTPSFAVYTTSAKTTSGTVRSALINQTQTGASASTILEALRVNIDANVQTGDWVNAIVARVDYGANGNASGGMVAPLCAELSLPEGAMVGGAYYIADLEMEAPSGFTHHGNVSYPTAWINIGVYGNATAITSLESNAFLFRTDGFTSGSGNMVYNNTIKVRVGSTTWYMPLSSAEGEYESAYLIDVTNTTDASSLTTASIQTDGGLAVAKQIYVGDDIDMSVSGTGTYDLTLKDAVADALSIVRGSTDVIVFDTSTPRVTITPATTITGLLTANGSIAVPDEAYVGITSNERFDFEADGLISVLGADFAVGATSADDVAPYFSITGDADSDAAGDTDETFKIDLTPNATPTSAVWDITSTQSAGYRVDKSFTVGLATPDDTTPTFSIRGDADSDAGDDVTEVFQVVLTPNATPTSATWGFTSTQSAGYTFDKAVTINGNITGYISPHALFIGTDSGVAGGGIPLTGSDWDLAQGVGIYGDDGGVALTGYTEVMTVQMLTTATVASGDVSTAAFHPALVLQADYTGVGGLSAIWGNTVIQSGYTITTAGSLGDVGGATFGIDIKGTLAANSHACGVSVGVGGSGTKTGILTGFRIRGATGTVDWDGIMSIEDGDGSWTSMTQSAGSDTATLTNGPAGTANNPDYWLKLYIGEDIYVFPIWKI